MIPAHLELTARTVQDSKPKHTYNKLSVFISHPFHVTLEKMVVRDQEISRVSFIKYTIQENYFVQLTVYILLFLNN